MFDAKFHHSLSLGISKALHRTGSLCVILWKRHVAFSLRTTLISFEAHYSLLCPAPQAFWGQFEADCPLASPVRGCVCLPSPSSEQFGSTVHIYIHYIYSRIVEGFPGYGWPDLESCARGSPPGSPPPPSSPPTIILCRWETWPRVPPADLAMMTQPSSFPHLSIHLLFLPARWSSLPCQGLQPPPPTRRQVVREGEAAPVVTRCW
jgi:hypothetical protein